MNQHNLLIDVRAIPLGDRNQHTSLPSLHCITGGAAGQAGSTPDQLKPADRLLSYFTQGPNTSILAHQHTSTPVYKHSRSTRTTRTTRPTSRSIIEQTNTGTEYQHTSTPVYKHTRSTSTTRKTC